MMTLPQIPNLAEAPDLSDTEAEWFQFFEEGDGNFTLQEWGEWAAGK